MKPKSVIMYGTDWCPDCTRAKHFLNTHKVSFEYINIDKDPAASDKVIEVNHGKRRVPTIFVDDAPLSNPTFREMKEALGI